MAIRRKYIRDVVARILDESHITDRKVPVKEIAESYNAVVRESPADDGLSGYILKDPSSGEIVIGVNSEQAPNRKRFTIAHELGHLVLHSDSIERWHLDRSGYGLRFRKDRSVANDVYDEDEVEANFFAAELLMPASFLEEDLQNVNMGDFLGEDEDQDVIAQVATTYGVSTRALTFRLAHLGYIQL